MNKYLLFLSFFIQSTAFADSPITNGIELEESDMPAVVRLQSKVIGKAMYAGCTGTFIAPHLILTAAHCVSGKENTTYIQNGKPHVTIAEFPMPNYDLPEMKNQVSCENASSQWDSDYQKCINLAYDVGLIVTLDASPSVLPLEKTS